MSWFLADKLTCTTKTSSFLTLNGFSQYIYAHMRICTVLILFAILPGDGGVCHWKFRGRFVFVGVAYHLDKVNPLFFCFCDKPKSLSLSSFGSSSLFLYPLAFSFSLLFESDSFSLLSSFFFRLDPLAFKLSLSFTSDSFSLLSSFSFFLYPLTLGFSLLFESDSFSFLSSFSFCL